MRGVQGAAVNFTPEQQKDIAEATTRFARKYLANRMQPSVLWRRINNIPDPVACVSCGATNGSLMFREYEAGTEWNAATCCEPVTSQDEEKA